MKYKYWVIIAIFYFLYSYSPYPVTNDGRYLGKITGHKCIRINNHEYTDLQEYTGIYTTSTDGTLVNEG